MSDKHNNKEQETTEVIPSGPTFDYKSFDPLQDSLFNKHNIEIPVWNWSSPPSRLIRIAVQLYNSMNQFEYLADALAEEKSEM